MTDITNLSTVNVAISNYIAVVTMNNPPVNAQNRQFHDDLTLVFDVLSDRNDVRSIVLTGAGKCFSAGADIKGRASQEPDLGDHWVHSRRVRECFYSIMECRKPIIAAINGAALGAGLAVAASADILIASESASVGLPEINVGLLGGGRHAMRLFGHSKTRRLMLTGQRLSGAEYGYDRSAKGKGGTKTANTYWHDWWGEIWDNVHGAGSAYSGRPCLGCG